MQLYLLHEPLEIFKVFGGELFHVGVVHGVVLLAVRTDVLVDVVGLGLQDADAPPVEPVLASVAADVESVGDQRLEIICSAVTQIGYSVCKSPNT